jgi:undecaprenyl diphosphate synthase
MASSRSEFSSPCSWPPSRLHSQARELAVSPDDERSRIELHLPIGLTYVHHVDGPRHIACIMDGNGRWAAQRGLSRADGHRAGKRAVETTIVAAARLGIEWVTLFAFSTENWDRPRAEVDLLVDLNVELIADFAASDRWRGLRVRYLGDLGEPVPQRLRDAAALAEERTRRNGGMTVTFAFNYGGRAEITAAARRLLACGVTAENLTEEHFSSFLQYPDMPDPDLVIRTSGEQRVSNFMLWQMAYAELVFLDTLWPDFGEAELEGALATYRRRTRRFGSLEGVA